LVLRREGEKFPWIPVLLVTFAILLIAGGIAYWAQVHYHMHWIRHWPFLIK